MQGPSINDKDFFDVENYLSSFMSVLLKQEVLVILENEIISAMQDDLLLHFNTKDLIYSISLDFKLLNLISGNKKNNTIDIIHNLTNSSNFESLGKPYLIDRKTNNKRFLNYSVFNKIGEFKYLGKISFNFETHNNYQKNFNLEKTNILPTKLFLNLGLNFYIDEISQAEKLIIDDKFYIQSEFLVNNQKFLISKISKTEFKICDLGVITMENKDVVLNIELGKLELSLEDFIKLRVGSVLNFDLPSNLEVMIKLGSRAWAMAEIMNENDQTTLKVNKIIELDNLKNCESH